MPAPLRVRPVAYLSAEFGLHESLPIYSGGLGVLAGDHLKSASDLGLPLVGGGALLPRVVLPPAHRSRGLAAGRVRAVSVDTLPAQPALGAGRASRSSSRCRSPTRSCARRCGRSTSGATGCSCSTPTWTGNSDENRQLAARLYFGDQRVRIRQELLLGVGGIRALRAAGVDWGVLHLNEGHSAFATLEFTRLRMEQTGRRFPDLRAGGGAEHGLHDPHAGRRRARSLSAAPGGRASRAAARNRSV